MKFRRRPSGDERSPKADEELSPDALAKELADLQTARADLTRTIDRLTGQIESLKTAPAAQPPPPSPTSESQAEPQPSVPAAAPPPPPPGFDVRGKSSRAPAPPPPPPTGIGAKASSPPPPPPAVDPKAGEPTIAGSPPPVDTETKLSPLDRLLGEDFGKPRPRSSSEPQSPPIKPKFSSSGASSKETAIPPPEPVFKVSPVLAEGESASSAVETASAREETSAKPQAPATTKTAAPFSFNTTLEQLRADEPGKNGQAGPATAPSPPSAPPAKISSAGPGERAEDSQPTGESKGGESPAPDFFRSGGQSFASAAAMVNDILAATPDAVAPESGQTEAEDQGGEAADELRAPEVPITPDFFTAQPKKRFRLRR